MKNSPFTDSKRPSERNFTKPQPTKVVELTEEVEFGSNAQPHFIPNPVSTYQSLRDKPEYSIYGAYSKKKFYRFRSYTNPLASFVFCCSDLCTPGLLEYLLKKFFSSKDPYKIHVTVLNDQNRAVSLKELCSDYTYFVYITNLGGNVYAISQRLINSLEEAYLRVSPTEEMKIFDSQIVDIISEAEYEEIRTKIGLGYLVSSSKNFSMSEAL